MQLVSDAYTFTLKLPPLQFSLVIAILPLLMSLVFTGVYLLDMQGLVPDDSVQTVYDGLQKGGHVAEAHWYALFQVRATGLRRGRSYSVRQIVCWVLGLLVSCQVFID